MFTSASRDINVVLQKEPTGQPCKTMGNLQITENERRKFANWNIFVNYGEQSNQNPSCIKKKRQGVGES